MRHSRWSLWLCLVALAAGCTNPINSGSGSPTVNVAPTETRAAELAQLATLTAPTSTAVATATAVATPSPTLTATAEPPAATATPEPSPTGATGTAEAPAATVTRATAGGVATVTVGAPWAENFVPYQIEGAYQRPDWRLYGRRVVALYGAGSGYDEGVWTFTVEAIPDTPLVLSFIGLDDERPEQATLQVRVNDVTAFAGPTSFPNVPADDNGEAAGDRYWARMNIPIPPGALRIGTNTLTLRNTAPWAGSLTSPYILINDLDFAVPR